MDMEKLKGKFQDLGRYLGGKKQDGDYDDEGEEMELYEVDVESRCDSVK